MGADDLFALAEDFDCVLDFTFVEVELFAEELFEDPLEVALLFPPERTRVIFPKVEPVFLDLVVVDVFGMFLSSGISGFFGLEIFTLLEESDSEAFVEVLPGEFLMKSVLSLSVLSRILLLLVGSTAGCVLTRLIWPMLTTEFRLRATLETFLALS